MRDRSGLGACTGLRQCVIMRKIMRNSCSYLTRYTCAADEEVDSETLEPAAPGEADCLASGRESCSARTKCCASTRMRIVNWCAPRPAALVAAD